MVESILNLTCETSEVDERLTVVKQLTESSQETVFGEEAPTSVMSISAFDTTVQYVKLVVGL
jgi:hypothetical protein